MTSLISEFWADGTYESRNYKGSDLNESELGTWRKIDPISLELNSVEIMTGEYVLGGDSISMTMIDGTDAIVVTMTKVS